MSTKDTACIEATGLRKSYGAKSVLNGVDLHVETGRILGLIGPNGAGKSTVLNAILGLTACKGQLKVLGRDPWTARDQLMREVAFIADVALLPRWMRVSQLLDYVVGVHPRFDRQGTSLRRSTPFASTTKRTATGRRYCCSTPTDRTSPRWVHKSTSSRRTILWSQPIVEVRGKSELGSRSLDIRADG